MNRRALLGSALAAPLAWRRKRHRVTQPWSNQAVALIVIQAGPGFTGLFLYSPAPGAGNLKTAIAAAGGTDPYGNPYPAQISTNDGVTVANLAGHGLQWTTPGDPAFGAPALFAVPSGTNGNSLQLTTALGKVSGQPGSISVYDSNASSTVPAIPAGQPGIFVPANCPIVSDTWHTMPAMANTWTIGGAAKYRMTAQGDLQVSFQDLVPGSTVDGTTIWAAGTFPSAYRPPINHRVVCFTDILRQPSAGIFGSAGLEFRTDGSVQCFGIAAAATRADLYATIPISA